MKALYLPVAQCWRVFFYDTMTDVRGVWSWQSRADLANDLRFAGLILNADDSITVEG